MAMLDSFFPSHWTYVAEGAMNVVLSWVSDTTTRSPPSPFTGKVLRLQKSAAKAKVKAKEQVASPSALSAACGGESKLDAADSDSARAESEVETTVRYLTSDIWQLLGSSGDREAYLPPVTAVRVSRAFLAGAQEWLEKGDGSQSRPDSRRGTRIDQNQSFAILMPNAMQTTAVAAAAAAATAVTAATATTAATLASLSDAGASAGASSRGFLGPAAPAAAVEFAVEIKPKFGATPTSKFVRHDVKKGVSRFQLHQRLKLAQGKVARMSGYCPLDLFSGDAGRMRRALRGLLRDPQNNLRLLQHGRTVFPLSQKDPPAAGGAEEESSLCAALTRLGLGLPPFRRGGAATEAAEAAAAAEEWVVDKLVAILLAKEGDNALLLPRLKRLQQLDDIDVEGIRALGLVEKTVAEGPVAGSGQLSPESIARRGLLGLSFGGPRCCDHATPIAGCERCERVSGCHDGEAGATAAATTAVADGNDAAAETHSEDDKPYFVVTHHRISIVDLDPK
eukprot:g6455.t1